MASQASPEASEIRRRGRQRLIGAIALVMVLVVFVPMLLDSEPRPTQPVAPIPARENAPPLPAPAPAATKVAPALASAPAPEPAKAPEVTKAAEAKQASPEPPKAAIAKAAATPPVTPAKAAPTLEGFAVQVGAFRDEAKLKQARDKLAAAGVVHYTERLDSPGGALTRLRAGPFPTREAAESAQASLKRVALEGKVVPLP